MTTTRSPFSRIRCSAFDKLASLAAKYPQCDARQESDVDRLRKACLRPSSYRDGLSDGALGERSSGNAPMVNSNIPCPSPLFPCPENFLYRFFFSCPLIIIIANCVPYNIYRALARWILFWRYAKRYHR